MPQRRKSESPNAIEECLLRSFEPLLCCIICAEVFHKAVNVIPCGHNFNLICLLRSVCSTKTTICPQCREPMHDIGLAYTINSIVDVFLELYPDRRRPSDELEVLDVMLRDVVSEVSLM
ncbi:zinc finger, C3HC4 type [Cooperia oncophora]